MMRLVGHARAAWRRLRRPVTFGVKAVVLDPEDRVLLVRHTYVRGWHLPGGGVGRGETPAEAAMREVREETGVEPVGPPSLLGLMTGFPEGATSHVAVYRAAAAPGEKGRPRRRGLLRRLEIAECGFFDRDGLPETAAPSVRRRLDEIFSGVPVSDRW